MLLQKLVILKLRAFAWAAQVSKEPLECHERWGYYVSNNNLVRVMNLRSFCALLYVTTIIAAIIIIIIIIM